MFKPKLISLILIVVLGAAAFAVPPYPVLRKSPDFTIFQPSGKPVDLSSFKGKVVVLEFMFVQSNHCLQVARMLNRLYGDLGASGFQPVAVVFDPPNARNSGGVLVQPMVEYFKLAYPVGYATKLDVDNFLGRTGNEILNIPQIVVIDKTGNIRATSGPAGGDPSLENEASLRIMIQQLLSEQATVRTTRKRGE